MQSTLSLARNEHIAALATLRPLPADAGPRQIEAQREQLRTLATTFGDVLQAAVTDLSCHAAEIVPEDADFAAAVTELVDEAIGVPVRRLIEQAVPVHVTGLYVVGR
jgi:hypothetical protein